MPDLNALTNEFFDRREAMRPTARVWAKHIALLLAAFITVTLAGVIEPLGRIPIFPEIQDPQNWSGVFNLIISLPGLYIGLVSGAAVKILTDFRYLKEGLEFSVSLLAILTAHEAGHYIACRIYGVDATLPYFIPVPPILSPAGTLGAFIKILSPMPSRRAVFDIGVAGPIAGFVVLIPVLIFGLLTMVQGSPDAMPPGQSEFHFADPLLTQILAKFIGINPDFGKFNPFLAAAWVGMLVTSLNLIPSGQLDGGHAIYSIFGGRVHFWMGRIAFLVMALFSVLGWLFYSSPSGLLFVVLLAVMMRVRHPEPLIDAPLDRKRKIIAALTLLIFILCFVPFPVQVR